MFKLEAFKRERKPVELEGAQALNPHRRTMAASLEQKRAVFWATRDIANNFK